MRVRQREGISVLEEGRRGGGMGQNERGKGEKEGKR